MGFIFRIKQKNANNESDGQLLVDFTQSFGKVDKDKLRRILYEKGIPVRLKKSYTLPRQQHSLRQAQK